MSSNNHRYNKSTFGCQYGSNTPKFDKSSVSSREVITPLNLNDTPHNFANEKRRQQRQQISKATTKWLAKLCKYCNHAIISDDIERTSSGKRIPLSTDGCCHECPENPFNLARQRHWNWIHLDY